MQKKNRCPNFTPEQKGTYEKILSDLYFKRKNRVFLYESKQSNKQINEVIKIGEPIFQVDCSLKNGQ